MKQAHLELQVIPWSAEGETSLTEELNFSHTGKFSRRPNKLECCWKIPYPLASFQPMLTRKNICNEESLSVGIEDRASNYRTHFVFCIK